MTRWLKQSTAVTVQFGPFLDAGDGVVPEVGLATNMDNASTGIRVSKNGATMIDRNSATAPAHDDDGYYRIELDATDTNTLGTLMIQYEESGTCTPGFAHFMVVPSNVWDSFFGADTLNADVTQIGGDTQSATDLKDFADAGYDPGTNKVQGLVLCDTTTTNSDMRGTDNAALASVLGALADAAAAGDPTSADTVMQYAKQLVNLLAGSAGIATMPAGANPANGVNLFEMVRAGLGATFDTATDSQEQLQADIVTVDTNVDTLITNVPDVISLANINTQCDTALSDIGLQYVLNTALPTNWATDVTANSALDQMADDGTAVYDRTTDSLQAIADSGGGGPTAEQIADAVWDEDATAHQTLGTFGQAIGDPVANAKTLYAALITDAAGASVTADVATVDANVDTLITNVPDVISLAAINAEADTAISDAALATAANLATAQADLDILTGTDGVTLATAQANYAPSKAADCWSDSTPPAGTAMARAVDGIVLGTCSGVPTTTNIPTSSLVPSAVVADQFKGRIVTFDDATSTTALRGQSTDITASTDAGVLTVTALTTAPASGDTFTIQ
jgi:hypothetical protein